MRAVILACAAATACTAPPSARIPNAVEPPQRLDVVREVAAGTTVQLRRTDIVRGRVTERTLLDGLLHEALRQSVAFDIAGGVESCDTELQLAPALDAEAKEITLSLVDGSGIPVPLASSSFAGRPVGDAVDDVAYRARVAMGEDVRIPPKACAAIFSPVPRTVRWTLQAITDEMRGLESNPVHFLKQAQRADSGCTMTLMALASSYLNEGDPAETIELAGQALTMLENRLSPTTTQRLARLLLMARARIADPATARDLDQQLLALGEAGQRDRPHDPHCVYTRALALNYLGRFEEAAPLLRELAERWPKVPWIGYHLAFAELSLGQAELALATVQRTARLLPTRRTVLPMTLALHRTGRREELDEYLAQLAASRLPRGSERTLHDLRRIQASNAILNGRKDAAAEFLLADLEWMWQRPSQLDMFAIHLAEEGEVLVRLGFARELGLRIEALHDLNAQGTAFRQALVYLGGLVELHDTGNAPEIAVATLRREDQTTWATLLRAAVHNQRGELIDETRELATAIRITDSALVRVSFASSLVRMGRREDAERLLEDTRRRLDRFDLRRPLDYPLFDPALALAWIAVENAEAR